MEEGGRPSPSAEPEAGGAPGASAAPRPGNGASAAPTPWPVGVSPTKLFESAQSDYFSGQYDLAIIGFTDYIRSFPKSDMADDAQVLICNAYLTDGKYQKAVEACDLAIRTYPNGDKI